jgi:hypothetical protein
MSIIKKENALPLMSVITILASAFGLWSGVFDRGATSGALSEKVTTIEQTVKNINESIIAQANADSVRDKDTQAVKIDVVRLQEQLASVNLQIGALKAEIEKKQ